jgi:hypothetical protein
MKLFGPFDPFVDKRGRSLIMPVVIALLLGLVVFAVLYDLLG